MLITFSGLDGSGKTTQLDLFTQYLKDNKFRYKRLRMYEDISLSPLLRKILNKKSKNVVFHKETGKLYRHDKNVKNPRRIFMRKFTYVADLLIIIIKRFYYEKIDRRIIIMDRYLYDSLANLFNTGSEIYTKLMLKIIPRPDIAILLDVEPDVAFNRKPEYPPKYYYERRKAYLSIFDKLESGFVVQSDTIERTEKTVQYAVQQKLVSNGISLKGDRNSFYVSHVLKTILGGNNLKDELCYIYKNKSDIKNVINTLNKNVATVRYIEKLNATGIDSIKEEFKSAYDNKLSRLRKGYEIAEKITKVFESEGVPIMCIKTVDNYPDIGHDFDFYTDAPIKEIDDILIGKFGGELKSPTLADRIARKRNYKIEEYPTIEMHCGKLGELGEDNLMAKDIIRNRIKSEIPGVSAYVPKLEYRLLLCVLQRMYRHFNIRICDIYNTVNLINTGKLDWLKLKKISSRYGIWEGVLLYLGYIKKMSLYYGIKLNLTESIKLKDWPRAIADKNMHFRFPLLRTGVNIYIKKVLHDIKMFNLYSLTRLLLVIPLSLGHFISVKIFGKSRIW